MKPLRVLALGLLVIALQARVSGYDIYADPIGWLMVLAGLQGLKTAPAVRLGGLRPTLWATAGVALVVSAVVWWPAVEESLTDGEPAIAWAANLPRFAFIAVLCHALAKQALAAGGDERAAAGWFSWAAIATGLVMIAPVLVFGASWSWLGDTAAVAAQLVQLLVMVLCFVYGGRVWAGAREGRAAGSSRDAAE